MKTRYIASMLSLLLLASVFTFGLTINKASADGTTLSIPSVSKTPSNLGETFTVPVQISNVADLFGFDIKITWDNTLITFLSLDKTPLDTVWPQGYFEPLAWVPPNTPVQSGAGYVRYSAVATGGSGYSGVGPTTLFTITFTIVKACNFPWSTPIHFDTVKLSNSAAGTISATLTDGQYSMSATVPDITFHLVNPTPSKPFEYCKIFEVEVYASHICAQMTDYDLTILYNAELLDVKDVDYWGVFGPGQFNNATPGVVHVWMDPVDPPDPHSGESLLLFALTFHIEFDDRIEHIWRLNAPQTLPAQISVKDDVGEFSFVEGHIPITGITLPSPLPLTIQLIKGDVDCNGQVTVFDLRCLAAYYDQSLPEKYDLTNDTPHLIDLFDLVVVATNFNYNYP